MTTNNPKDLLGMDVGTATNRLKKQMLFQMAVALELDNCHKCDSLISTYEELTMDHIRPWRPTKNGAKGNADLFWDLDNIAFTHRKCNKQDRTTAKIGPNGTSWCYRCKDFLPVEIFSKALSRHNGLSSRCKPCDKEMISNYDCRNPRHPCPQCEAPMRKKCPSCKFELPMKDYMALRRNEGVNY